MPKECDLQVFCCFVSYCMNAQSRVSAEKKDYYDSKLMLHWSYICTSAGCFLGGIFMLCGGFLFTQVSGAVYNAINHNHYNYYNYYNDTYFFFFQGNGTTQLDSTLVYAHVNALDYNTCYSVITIIMILTIDLLLTYYYLLPLISTMVRFNDILFSILFINFMEMFALYDILYSLNELDLLP